MNPSTGFQEFKQYNFIGQQERAMYKKYKHTYCNYIPLLIMENDINQNIDGNKLPSSYKIVWQTYREKWSRDNFGARPANQGILLPWNHNESWQMETIFENV